jgi:hypothetical protein
MNTAFPDKTRCSGGDTTVATGGTLSTDARGRHHRQTKAHRCLVTGGSLALALTLQAGGVAASEFADWSVYASNTLRAEYYGASGDTSASPWPHLGGQLYDEVDLSMHRRVSPWESLRIDLSALANDSEYRFDENTAVIERARLFWEKGDGGMPFRLAVGDYYAAQSPRTVQLGLKGGQVELQPRAGQSIQLFSGLSNPTYRDLDADNGVYTGASWLTDHASLGSINLTGLHYRRAAATDQPALNQDVVSAAWYRPFELGLQTLELEAELGHFSGDYDDTGSAVDGSDQAVMVQLRSRTDAFGYRLRFERNGEHYRPAGGAITSDHRGIEGHIDGTTRSGRQWRGRLQSFRDDLESDNPLDTDVAGFAVSGPLAAGSTTFASLDGFVQRRRDDDDSVDEDTLNLRMDLTRPLSDRVTGRAGLGWTDTDDQAGGTDKTRSDLRLILDTRFGWQGWRGVVSPGLALRSNRGEGSSNEVNPTLTLSADRGAHRLRFSYNWLSQDGRDADTTDTDLRQTALAYAYRRGQHELGIEGDLFDRAPDGARDTEAYRVSAYWKVSFDRPARQRDVATPAMAALPTTGLPYIGELAPGLALQAIEETLAGNRLQPAYRQDGLVVYEARLLDAISLRQRLALVETAGILESATLVIAFSDTGNAAATAGEYLRVRDTLLQRYGAPQDSQESGEFSANLNADMVLGRFERRLDWRTDGGVIRFGIPRRIDGEVRMELTHASRLPPGDAWGLDALR